MRKPCANDIYRHFKGNLYQIIDIAIHSETEEELVIYKAMYGDGKVFARPLENFCSKVDKEKYPEVIQEYRFEKVENPSASGLDSALEEFLDSTTYEEKLNILASVHHRITDSMLNTMAAVSEVELKEVSLEDKYVELKHCLLLKEKYECKR